ncbi:MAG: hypothetical protein HeimC2_37720 [Candidatus Heimdallarchaeota archaeon LC_2]|nr:MAG: hypothetical protein HeimC2_37720 [Candidatus Heimdallarchaeota archaeon LC_2]
MNNTSEARRESYEHIKPKISDTKKQLLRSIKDFFDIHKTFPTGRQLASFSGIDPFSVVARINELTKDGYITPWDNPKGKRKGTLKALTRKSHSVLLEGD